MWFGGRARDGRCLRDALVAVRGIAQHGSLGVPPSLLGACCAPSPLHGSVDSPHSAWLLLPLSAFGFRLMLLLSYSRAAGSPHAWCISETAQSLAKLCNVTECADRFCVSYLDGSCFPDCELCSLLARALSLRNSPQPDARPRLSTV
jgi:hypothetical protein